LEAELVKMIGKKEKNLFTGFLWKVHSEENNPFYFPRIKGEKIFLEAKEKFSNELKIFSGRPGDGQVIALQNLINDSISGGYLETTTTSSSLYFNLWNCLGPNFTITSRIWANNEVEKNYKQNKEVIDYLFELYKK